MHETKRTPAADVIRIFALFLVVSVHFFLHTGFYKVPVEGERMFVMTIMRSFFIICVPLFIMLSGYLLHKKKLERKYYGRFFKIYLTYVLASLLCILYSAVFQKQAITAKSIILNILAFSGAKYSWYVEMYLGLFLLIPFLNIVYHALPSQKCKLWLIFTFVILTSLPPVTNIYDLSSADWWALPSASSAYNQLIPAWWQQLYPLTYYFIGCYLGEYGLKINKFLHAVLILIVTCLSGAFCYWRSYKTTFISGAWCAYHSLFNVVLTLLVFSFILNLNYDKIPGWLARFLQKLSGLCLGGYLVSWIFDLELYPRLIEKVPLVTSRLAYYFVIVPAVFVLSLLASYVLSKIQLLLEKAFSLIYALIQRKLL